MCRFVEHSYGTFLRSLRLPNFVATVTRLECKGKENTAG
jgi:hypothetical protein